MIPFNDEVLLRYSILNPPGKEETRIVAHSSLTRVPLVAMFGLEMDILKDKPQELNGAFYEYKAIESLIRTSRMIIHYQKVS
jgi:hypothetical protein